MNTQRILRWFKGGFFSVALFGYGCVAQTLDWFWTSLGFAFVLALYVLELFKGVEE